MAKAKRQQRMAHVLDLLPTLTTAELERIVQNCGDEIVSAKRSPLLLTINGYNDDPRELWEIPEVRALCQRVESSGLIGLLHVNIGERLELLIGAWDIYAFARGLVRSKRVVVTPDHLADFQRVLDESNRVVDRILEKGVMNRHQRRRAQALSKLPGPGSTPEQLADRLHLLHHNEAAVQMAFDQAMALGDGADMTVLLIDTRDSLGKTIADQVDPERRAARIAGPNQIPTILMAVPRRLVGSALRTSHPTIAAGLASPAPRGTFAVVCIASEGITMAHFPIVEQSKPAEA